MTSMLALNYQKKSGHTEFYGVSVALFCFMVSEQDTCSRTELQSANIQEEAYFCNTWD